VTADQGTAHKLRPRLFLTFVVNSLPLWSNSTPLWVTLLLLCMFLIPSTYKVYFICESSTGRRGGVCVESNSRIGGGGEEY